MQMDWIDCNTMVIDKNVVVESNVVFWSSIRIAIIGSYDSDDGYLNKFANIMHTKYQCVCVVYDKPHMN